jgi:hypothetical protein
VSGGGVSGGGSGKRPAEPARSALPAANSSRRGQPRPTPSNERLTWRGSSRFEQPACKQLHPPAGRKSRWLTGSIGEPEPVLGVRASFLSALQPAVTSVSSGVVVWFIYLA